MKEHHKILSSLIDKKNGLFSVSFYYTEKWTHFTYLDHSTEGEGHQRSTQELYNTVNPCLSEQHLSKYFKSTYFCC